MHPRKQEILDIVGKEPETLDELAKCVIAVIESQDNTDRWKKKTTTPNKFKVVGFKWDITYGDISNSHSSPLSGVQNWGCRDDSGPTSYPGWHGRCWIRYRDYPHSFGSTPFEKTLTHTGSGGGGGYDGPWEEVSSMRYCRYGHKEAKNPYPKIECYSWYYRIYEDDWPELKKRIREDRMWSEIAGTKDPKMHHEFEWYDPETVIKDAEFIAECLTIKGKK